MFAMVQVNLARKITDAIIKPVTYPWPNGTAKLSQLARKLFNFLTTTAQSPDNNKTTWRQLAQVGGGGQMVENFA